ncbi:respiratory nitrate reductase subunit gamma [Chloroflexota bacterium]
MESITLPQIATYVSYVFVVIAYAVKVRKYFSLPKNLRWEIYPVGTEAGQKSKYGGSYFEDLEFWTKPVNKSQAKGIWEMAKKYLTMWGYFRRVRSYWFALYPWHIGFYLIVLFHGLALLGAILIKTANLDIAGTSANSGGQILYYATIAVALGSFILGTIGSVGLLIKRIVDRSLRDYASPQNYFNYVFFLIVFVSGLVSYAVADSTFTGYREFWVGLISLKGVAVHPAEFVHIMLFSVFLIYLPYTRSTHYITKILAYFKVRWDDKPNFGSPEKDEKLAEALNWQVGWAAPHIQTGQSWGNVVTNLPHTKNEEGKR